MNSKFLTRGKCRHSYLRKAMNKVACLRDFDQTYVSELGLYLRKTFPTLRDDCKLYIKHEVTIQNRRPDFVIHVPNVALILLEYKTSNVTTKVRREYLTQVLDTYHKFRQSLCVSENSSHIRLLLLFDMNLYEYFCEMYYDQFLNATVQWSIFQITISR